MRCKVAVFWKKKTETKEVRRCLNCGKDISNKRKDAKFCCNACWQGYQSLPITTIKPPTIDNELFWLEKREDKYE